MISSWILLYSTVGFLAGWLGYGWDGVTSINLKSIWSVFRPRLLVCHSISIFNLRPSARNCAPSYKYHAYSCTAIFTDGYSSRSEELKLPN
ncbi:hypothetical protein HOY82DRAFT_547949 [Tuber indicum]|nr:hypothetical protein HOY82DRAFT_547949 [Tuber indicum]